MDMSSNRSAAVFHFSWPKQIVAETWHHPKHFFFSPKGSLMSSVIIPDYCKICYLCYVFPSINVLYPCHLHSLNPKACSEPMLCSFLTQSSTKTFLQIDKIDLCPIGREEMISKQLTSKCEPQVRTVSANIG